jgi:hypothetical protein
MKQEFENQQDTDNLLLDKFMAGNGGRYTKAGVKMHFLSAYYK